MRYFKLIKNNTIFGVIDDNNFRKFQKKYGLVLYSDIESAEFIDFQEHFYYAPWINPYPSELKEWNIETIQIEQIQQEEYNILKETLQIQQQIINEQSVEENFEPIIEEPTIQEPEEPNFTLEYVKKVKIAELKRDNQQKLKQGSTITLENGKTYSFSFDNMGLFNLITAMTTQQQSQENITFIIQKMNEFKQQCDQHCEKLITYVNTLDNIVDINNVHYQEQEV